MQRLGGRRGCVCRLVFGLIALVGLISVYRTQQTAHITASRVHHSSDRSSKFSVLPSAHDVVSPTPVDFIQPPSPLSGSQLHSTNGSSGTARDGGNGHPPTNYDDQFWPTPNPDNLWILKDGLSFSRYPNSTAVQQLRRHFCQGPAYDQFSRLLHLYATKTTLQGPTWGRRRQQQHANVGIMDQARILAFGNSHLRQAVFAWIAQHMSDDQVLRVTRVYHHYYVRVDFTNNATIYVLASSYAPFSPQWQVAIQELTDNSTLSDFDAVVVGNVNACSTARLEDLLADHPELSCDYAEPEPQDWMRAYPGRILVMSSFMRRRRRHQDGPLPETNTIGQDEQWARIVLEARANGRDNVGFVYGRHYIEPCVTKEPRARKAMRPRM
jgi:hypothetical protein